MSSKTMWEARSNEEWQVEKAFHDTCSLVRTFGELVEAKKDPMNPLNAQKLQNWEAGADKMGVMLNIVMELT